MSTINEQSALWLQARFLDRAGALVEPSAITYRVDCLSTGAALLGWTSVDPAQDVEIRIAAPLNAIQDRGNAKEHKRLTLVAAYSEDAADQLVVEHDWTVRRVDFI